MSVFSDAIRALAGGQVYPVVMPDKHSIFPTIVYTPIHQEKIFGINGSQKIERIRMQVDVYSNTFTECVNIQREIYAALRDEILTLSDVRLTMTDYLEESRLHRLTYDFTYFEKEES